MGSLSKQTHLSVQRLPSCPPLSMWSAVVPAHGLSGPHRTRVRGRQWLEWRTDGPSFLRELGKGHGPSLAPRCVGSGGTWRAVASLAPGHPRACSLTESDAAPGGNRADPQAHLPLPPHSPGQPYPLTHHPVVACDHGHDDLVLEVHGDEQRRPDCGESRGAYTRPDLSCPATPDQSVRGSPVSTERGPSSASRRQRQRTGPERGLGAHDPLPQPAPLPHPSRQWGALECGTLCLWVPSTPQARSSSRGGAALRARTGLGAIPGSEGAAGGWWGDRWPLWSVLRGGPQHSLRKKYSCW